MICAKRHHSIICHNYINACFNGAFLSHFCIKGFNLFPRKLMYHILQFIYLEKKDTGLSLQIYPHKIKNFEKELSPQKENYIIPNKISRSNLSHSNMLSTTNWPRSIISTFSDAPTKNTELCFILSHSGKPESCILKQKILFIKYIISLFQNSLVITFWENPKNSYYYI